MALKEILLLTIKSNNNLLKWIIVKPLLVWLVALLNDLVIDIWFESWKVAIKIISYYFIN
jgi:hypothetical protein